MYRLIHLSGDLKGRRRIVQRRSVTLGSDLACPIWFPDAGVSPRHVELEETPRGLRLRRLEAGAPVRVNGEAVDERVLGPRDVVEIGAARFRCERAPPAALGWIRTAVLTAAVLAAAGIGMRKGIRWRSARRAADDAALVAGGSRAPPPSRESEDLRTMTRLTGELPEERPAMDVPSTPPEVAVRAPMPQEFPAPPRVPALPAAEPTPEAAAAGRDARLADELRRAVTDAARDPEAALGRLAGIRAAAPEFLPVYAESARLLERLGRRGEAERVWADLLYRAGSDPLAESAAAELARLASLRQPNEPPPAPPRPPPEPPPAAAPAPTPTPAPATPTPGPAGPAAVARAATPIPAPPAAPARPSATALPRRIRIVSVDQKRFPAGEEADELRVLHVVLDPAPEEKAVLQDRVAVEVEFFDQEAASGRPVPARALTTANPIRLAAGIWPSGRPKAVAATYQVPRGGRADGSVSFLGYVVKVYYGGDLQDVEAQPSDLAPSHQTPNP